MIDGIPSPRWLPHTHGPAPGSTPAPRLSRSVGKYLLNLTQSDSDPDVEKVTVAEAINRLTQALHDLPNRSAQPRALTAGPAGGIRLAVEGLVDNNMTPRPGTLLRCTVNPPARTCHPRAP